MQICNFQVQPPGKREKLQKEIVNLRKNAKYYLQNICKRFAKYLQKTRRQNSKKKHNIFANLANILQKTQFQNAK